MAGSGRVDSGAPDVQLSAQVQPRVDSSADVIGRLLSRAGVLLLQAFNAWLGVQ